MLGPDWQRVDIGGTYLRERAAIDRVIRKHRRECLELGVPEAWIEEWIAPLRTAWYNRIKNLTGVHLSTRDSREPVWRDWPHRRFPRKTLERKLAFFDLALATNALRHRHGYLTDAQWNSLRRKLCRIRHEQITFQTGLHLN